VPASTGRPLCGVLTRKRAQKARGVVARWNIFYRLGAFVARMSFSTDMATAWHHHRAPWPNSGCVDSLTGITNSVQKIHFHTFTLDRLPATKVPMVK